MADLGAIDVERGLDHGIPTYNTVRQAFGLRPISSFTELTGEPTDRFPNDRLIDSRNPLNDPNILDFVQLRDINGNVIPLDSPDRNEDAVVGIRRTTLAARLKAIYGDVSKLDAFTGMVSESTCRNRVRATAARNLEEAVRGSPRRRPVLLPNDPA